jgi:hypothetical protein
VCVLTDMVRAWPLAVVVVAAEAAEVERDIAGSWTHAFAPSPAKGLLGPEMHVRCCGVTDPCVVCQALQALSIAWFALSVPGLTFVTVVPLSFTPQTVAGNASVTLPGVFYITAVPHLLWLAYTDHDGRRSHPDQRRVRDGRQRDSPRCEAKPALERRAWYVMNN